MLFRLQYWEKHEQLLQVLCNVARLVVEKRDNLDLIEYDYCAESIRIATKLETFQGIAGCKQNNCDNWYDTYSNIILLDNFDRG